MAFKLFAVIEAAMLNFFHLYNALRNIKNKIFWFFIGFFWVGV